MSQNWTDTIKPKGKLLSLNLKEVWRYRDLVLLLVKRDFVSVYKQTVLGPLWYILQPLITTITFTIVFGKIAKIPTDGVPRTLFYMAGIVPWGYFSSTLTRTSNTFIENTGIFGKVYFPRLTVPFSIVISNLISFSVQIALLVGFIFYFHYFYEGFSFIWSPQLILLPLLITTMGILSLGIGLVISSFTTKYKDFKFLIQFGVQLFMYATPVIYPLSLIKKDYPFLAEFIPFNPMVGIIENFKSLLLKGGNFDWSSYSISLSVSLVIFILGGLTFSRTEKSFIDTV